MSGSSHSQFGFEFEYFYYWLFFFVYRTLANLTGYTIVVEDVRQHILGDSGNIDETQYVIMITAYDILSPSPFRTDFIFHAVDPATGEIVDFDVFIRRLDVAEFFRLIDKCNPQSITVRETIAKYEMLVGIFVRILQLVVIYVDDFAAVCH